eukprot:TRINITY_DN4662_c0_g1_i1.p1 TRINITY_DN4662_c0_g1~~TRINITY_DN4662_c0_g1_i1.p1  ORF type:complete len:287 (-),score=56.17 TRINITY_DN4662_c0_g1_i1:161-1021(-)
MSNQEASIILSEKLSPKFDQEALKYIPPNRRVPIGDLNATVENPNYDENLRKVSVVIHQHIGTGELLYEEPKIQSFNQNEENYLSDDVTEAFNEEKHLKPQWKYQFVTIPSMPPFSAHQLERVPIKFAMPTVEDIYQFIHLLFVKNELSTECSIICLIYVERLMNKVDLVVMKKNWRTIMICGMLLASKVWQDLSSWNFEFASVYPQFSLASINRLERIFLHHMDWDLYVSGKVYAQYFYALRAIVENPELRKRYNEIKGLSPGKQKVIGRKQESNDLIPDFSKSM